MCLPVGWSVTTIQCKGIATDGKQFDGRDQQTSGKEDMVVFMVNAAELDRANSSQSLVDGIGGTL